MLNKFKGYRTMAVAAITIILGALNAATGVVTDPTVLSSIAAVIGVITFILRQLTDTPAGSNGSGA